MSSINIRPGVSVLSVLQHLNYRPWFALSEFVDNSIQSFLDAGDDIKAVDGGGATLRVEIVVDSGDTARIVVRDNAGGIAQADFPRAFRPAELPPDRSGLSEFGMGMKSAACWFAPRWRVRTSVLGDPFEREIEFDIERIVNDNLEELEVRATKTAEDAHYTEVILENLHRPPVGRTLGKIKEHLKDIYRHFTEDGKLDLQLNGEVLTYEPPEILQAPHYREPEGKPIVWRKDFEFDFGQGLRANGFAAIRSQASTSYAGFALFRRRRLIQGSGDEGYRPEFIFGKSNTFVYQRVFGEISLEGFDVSHTKDGFQWDENEQPFLEILREELTGTEIPLLQQAREYRVARKPSSYRGGAKVAADRVGQVLRQYAGPIVERLSEENHNEPPPKELHDHQQLTRRVIEIELKGQRWLLGLELTADPAVGDWLELSEQLAPQPDTETTKTLGVRLSLGHPFMQRFSGVDSDEIEPFLRLASALALAEVIARDGGIRMAGSIRRNINELLRHALWRTP